MGIFFKGNRKLMMNNAEQANMFNAFSLHKMICQTKSINGIKDIGNR